MGNLPYLKLMSDVVLLKISVKVYVAEKGS